jgi:hypothetical protein
MLLPQELVAYLEGRELEERLRLEKPALQPPLRFELHGIIPPQEPHATHGVRHVPCVAPLPHNRAIRQHIVLHRLLPVLHTETDLLSPSLNNSSIITFNSPTRCEATHYRNCWIKPQSLGQGSVQVMQLPQCLVRQQLGKLHHCLLCHLCTHVKAKAVLE